MAPVVFRSASSGSVANGAALSVAKNGVVSGDLLIAFQNTDDAARTFTTPTGFALLGTSQTNPGRLSVYWKIAGGSEPANYGFAISGPSDHSATVLAFQAGSFNAADPIAVFSFGGSTTASTNHVAPALTGVVDGELVCAWAANGAAGASRTYTPPSGMTERSDTQVSGGASWTAQSSATQDLTSTASTGTKTAVCSVSTAYKSVSLIVAPIVATDYTRTPADTAAATDTAGFVLTIPRTAGPDPAAATDAVGHVYGWGRTPGPDTAAAGDASSRVMQMQRGPADAAPVLDAVTVEFNRTDILDYQFVLSEGPKAAGAWVPFGLGQTVVVENFDPGMAESRTQDVLSPTADVRWFGKDLRTPPTWSFDLYTDVETPEAALEWAQVMEEVWDAETLRHTPNGVVPLRYRRAGMTRRVYGRPRDFTMIPSHLRTGRVHMVADFALAEHTYYDDAEVSITVRTIPNTTSTGGVTFPITFPMTIGEAGDSPRVEQARVGGRRATWVDVVFYGPAMNPWVDIGGVRWALRGQVVQGHPIRMSGKPWQQGIQRTSDGGWLPGMLDPRARLSQLRLKPGTYPVKYGATDATGTSYATVAWRDAYGTM